jgi:biofilm PGA synthesis N-glycosyltransferase PgaC
MAITTTKMSPDSSGVAPKDHPAPNLPRYVLITPARNEAAFIAKTLESMSRQTVPPVKWVIVDDGSSDDTAAIVQRYLPAHPWIELVQRPPRKERHFAAKVQAFNTGLERMAGLDYEILGNLDADTSFGPDHFEFLLSRFQADPKLGVAGTVFREDGGYRSDQDSFEGQFHVAGACQIFRRECWDAIGGYIPIPGGGIDWSAVINARMKGWKTRSYRERTFYHHRKLGTADRGPYAAAFAYGSKDYQLGGHPVWEACRVAYRMARRPYLVLGLTLGAGYLWAWLRRIPRPVSPELMRFHRREQMAKLRAILRAAVSRRRQDAGAGVDKFEVGTK